MHSLKVKCNFNVGKVDKEKLNHVRVYIKNQLRSDSKTCDKLCILIDIKII